MITAREIAKLVNVSVSTVGRAMAGDPRISAATRAKVRRAADRVGYAGSAPARIVRGGTSNLIGLLVPEISNDFYSTIAQALSEVCGREGYRLVLSLTRDDKDEETKHIRELVSARAAGMIIVPTAAPKRASVQFLKHIPHVQLLRKAAAIGDAWFGIDDSESLEQATAHLRALGHRRVAYIGGSDKLSTGAARLQGFKQGCSKAGLQEKNTSVMVGEPTREFGVYAIKEMLNLPAPPTAVVAGSVNITFGIIEAIETMGGDVPSTLSVVGFGDPEWFKWWRGGLTTIRPPVDNLATGCGLWFLHQLREQDGPMASLPSHSSVVSSSLVIRKSTRTMRAG
jgi:LacI family transcriptional regulator